MVDDSSVDDDDDVEDEDDVKDEVDGEDVDDDASTSVVPTPLESTPAVDEPDVTAASVTAADVDPGSPVVPAGSPGSFGPHAAATPSAATHPRSPASE